MSKAKTTSTQATNADKRPAVSPREKPSTARKASSAAARTRPSTNERPVLAISVGCPAGVGPEVAVLGAAATAREARNVLVGDRALLDRAAALRRVGRARIVPVHDAAGIEALRPGQIGWWSRSTALSALPAFGAPDREGGAAQLAWVDEATDLVRGGIAAALVTGPVSKAAIASSGAPGAGTFRGHTEHLAARLSSPEVIMAFAGDELVTALVTTHLAIADVPAAITPDAVASAAFHLARLVAALRAVPARVARSRRAPSSPPGASGAAPRAAVSRPAATSSAPPRIAIASLNPHAGESGLLGREEIDRIAPGIALARARLIAAHISAELVGPIGAETAIRLAASGTYAGVVTMYHDQATIPSKLLGFGEAVNITLGLPMIRTSVDHGTAHDVAGTGRADPRGMIEALRMALRLARAARIEPAQPAA